MTSSDALLQAALSAVARGWHVLPVWWPVGDACACGHPECRKGGEREKNVGKHPILAEGLTGATTSEAQVKAWWKQWPAANVAVVMAPSGLVALDVDLYHGDAEKLEALQAQLGPLPDTAEQQSGSGQGAHLIYKAPAHPVRGQLGGVVLRSSAYIVLAPSLHRSGGHYQWERSPDEWPVAELPQAWAEAMRREDPLGDVGVPEEASEPEWLKKISQEERVAKMREHLQREKGEVMGQDPPGTAFNVCRTCARGYAVRDPQAVLAALVEVYNPKCVPPYAEEALADRLAKVYDSAHSPEWGERFEPMEARCQQLFGAGFHLPPPPSPGAGAGAGAEPEAEQPPKAEPKPPGSYLEFLAAMAALIVRLSRSKSELKQRDCRYLRLWKAGQVIYEFEQLMEVLVTVVRLAPVGTPDEHLYRSCELLGNPDEVREALAEVIAKFHQPADAEPEPPEDDAELRESLKVNDKGKVTRGDANVTAILRYSQATRDQLSFDVVKKTVKIGGAFSSEPTGQLDVACAEWLDREWDVEVSYERVGRVITRLAMKYGSHDPIVDYLESEPWDGERRVDTWLVDYCGVRTEDLEGEDITQYVGWVGARWLIGAVARAVVPGCKMDTVLVLEGEQGVGKSRTLDVLGGEWFTDTPVDIGHKDAYIQIQSSWVVELAELAALVKSATESQKAFISARRDNFRPPYGKEAFPFPRRCVFGGTVNPSRDGLVDYLKDDSGNRRWWPVRVGAVDAGRLRDDRRQLFAEALHRYRSADLHPEYAAPGEPDCPGERWWLSREEQLVADRVTAHRRPKDAWSEVIYEWATRAVAGQNGIGGSARPKDRWSIAEVARQALQIEARDLKRNERDVARALYQAGFCKAQVRVGNRRSWLWSHPDLSVPASAIPAADKAN